LNEVAPRKTSVKEVTRGKLQEFKFELKAVAFSNILVNSCRLLTSQEDKSDVKEIASSNIEVMLLTLETFQEDRSALNEDAP